MPYAERDNHARGPQVLELRVAARLENLAVVRTVIGAVGTFEDLDLDAVADLRLAVDEACTRLIRSAEADDGASLILVIDPRVNEVVVEVALASALATSPVSPDEILAPGSFSWHVLTSLTDDVKTFRDGTELDGFDALGGFRGAGQVVGISMTTRRVSPAR
jgi:anti-sigma regulatory factor (Ser/Thr protein kinase)